MCPAVCLCQHAVNDACSGTCMPGGCTVSVASPSIEPVLYGFVHMFVNSSIVLVVVSVLVAVVLVAVVLTGGVPLAGRLFFWSGAGMAAAFKADA